MWSLPSVDEWLAELHGLSPPQLTMPVAGQAVRKRAPPPLFGNPGETAPAAAARPPPRLPADEGAEAQVTATLPIGGGGSGSSGGSPYSQLPPPGRSAPEPLRQPSIEQLRSLLIRHFSTRTDLSEEERRE